MSDLNLVLSKLVNLQKEELKEVSIMIKWLSEKGNEEKYDEKEEVFYNSLQKELLNTGVGSMKYFVFVNTPNYRIFKNGFSSIEVFIDRNFIGISKTEEIKLYNIFSRLLVSWIKEINIPLTIGAIAKNIGKIPELFEREFPDYLKSGLAKAVINL